MSTFEPIIQDDFHFIRSFVFPHRPSLFQSRIGTIRTTTCTFSTKLILLWLKVSNHNTSQQIVYRGLNNHESLGPSWGLPSGPATCDVILLWPCNSSDDLHQVIYLASTTVMKNTLGRHLRGILLRCQRNTLRQFSSDATCVPSWNISSKYPSISLSHRRG